MCFSCFCVKQKTAYEMRSSDWSSDVCSSDLGFLLPCIVGLGALFDPRDQAPLLALATSYALSLLVGCFLYARTFARQHSASVQLEEKSEVVSLLLREYEHGASDWLWQTDPARRLSGVRSEGRRVGQEVV